MAARLARRSRTPLMLVPVAVVVFLTACQPLSATDTGGTDTSKPLVASAATAGRELTALTVEAAGSISGYDRDDFPTWDSQGGGCDTRDIVLKRDGDNVRATADCKIIGGTWTSSYNGKTYTSAQDLQIDHVVPLGDAYTSGAKGWSRSKKKAFANDLKDNELLAVDISDNERKGDSDPSDWRPPDRDFWCTYAKDWISVKTVWHLTVTSAERSALTEMLHTCS